MTTDEFKKIYDAQQAIVNAEIKSDEYEDLVYFVTRIIEKMDNPFYICEIAAAANLRTYETFAQEIETLENQLTNQTNYENSK